VTSYSQKPKRLLPTRSLPHYKYLPGLGPHPIRHVEGHMYGQVEPEADYAHLLWSIDLFNEGFYWEAHEAFELLWKDLDNDNPYKWLLQSIILSAAATLKSEMGLDAPAIRLHKKAVNKMTAVIECDVEIASIIDVSKTAANVFRAAETRETPYVVVGSLRV
jgi:hypothetical protein